MFITIYGCSGTKDAHSKGSEIHPSFRSQSPENQFFAASEG
jgi:hypothetical protein